ncbi:energy-coupling factor transporter ATPase [Bacillus sp. FJAT-45037]|uniref:energy-coupling factor transporter ATPase n=1 Tax=Bacillus sp. FJAT-45037 TaxID=2011007 RepID=UPI000C23FCB2|nr:energy-coupling factor transporter ATPase [Bacillus sp. FJAT-45037]
MERFIELDNVSFQYDEIEDLVLKQITLSIYRKEWVSVLGRNGSGKSTFGRLLNGLLIPNQGEVSVDGFMTANEEDLWQIRKRIGMVFQNPEHQFVATTVRDDLAFGLENLGVGRDEMVGRIETYSQLIGINHLLDAEPHRLSGGQKQRVAIAGILALEPDLIIFDEATSMLDPSGREDVMMTMQMLHERGVAILTITHDMEEAVMAERVLIFENGEIKADGPPKEVFQSSSQLEKVGLHVPFSLQLQQELKGKGYQFAGIPLTDEELVDELWTLYSNR